MQQHVSALAVPAISLAALALVACGSTTPIPSGSGAPATSSPTAAPTATAGPVSVTCPTETVLNGSLGLTVSAPKQQPTTGNPPGDTGVSCQYTSTDFRDVVILVIGRGPVKVDFFTSVEAGQRKAATQQGVTYNVAAVSGVGDKADYVTFAKGGGATEDGILAQSANAGVIVTVVPAVSESRLEAFASQLLG